MKQRYIKLYTL